MKKFLTVFLSALLCMSLFCAAASAAEYSDISDHWAKGAIERWSSYGIVQGGDGGRFSPDAVMTRGQAATVFAKLLKLEAKADLKAYSDMAVPEWYDDAIAKCVQAGILKGSDDGKMYPNSAITREMFFVMFARALNIPGEDTLNKSFSDTAKVSDWARSSVCALINKSYVKGSDDGRICPAQEINRASVMALLDQTISEYAVADNKPVITLRSSLVAVIRGGGGGGSSAPTTNDLVVTAAGSQYTGGTYNNVTIASSVGDGDVTFNGVTVSGKLTIKGGGSNTICLKDCTLSGNVYVEKISGETPRLLLDNTPISTTIYADKAVILEADEDSPVARVEAKADVYLQGDDTEVSAVYVNAADVTINGSAGAIEAVYAAKSVTVSSEIVQKIEVTAAATVTITGEEEIDIIIGTEKKVFVNGNTDNVTVEPKPGITPKVTVFKKKAELNVSSNGNAVVATAYSDYSATLAMPKKDSVLVSAAAASATVSMWDVASLDVEGEKTLTVSFTSSSAATPDLNTWLNNVVSFGGGTTVNGTIFGKSFAYSIGEAKEVDDQLVITAATNEEQTREAWQALTAKVDVTEQGKDDSYALIKNGSLLQIGTERLYFESEEDLRLDNLGNIAALETNVRSHVALATGYNVVADAQVYAVVKAGTQLAVGSTVATLTEDVEIKLNGLDTDEIDNWGEMLSDLRDAEGFYAIAYQLVRDVNFIVGAAEGQTVTVSVSLLTK